jgi:hypothetical protein
MIDPKGAMQVAPFSLERGHPGSLTFFRTANGAVEVEARQRAATGLTFMMCYSGDMANLELVLELLRRMQADLRDIKDTQREHTRRLGHIELNTAQQNVADAEQSTRIDRLADRIERIETRLELRE